MTCCIENITVGVKGVSDDCVVPVEKVDFGHNIDVGTFFCFISRVVVLVLDVSRHNLYNI